MKILVACEESQAVTMEFRKIGHEAYSCDILPCSGGHPEWHIQGDVLEVINSKCVFATQIGEFHAIEDRWDMIIAFPPCTHLAVSGACWFKEKIADGRQQRAIDFFLLLANANCEKVVIENPISIMSNMYRKPDQIVHPWMFGHPEKKSTCLWLRGVPRLRETNNVKEKMLTLPKNEQNRMHYLSPSKNRSILRSKTFPGIAKAMATQYSEFVHSGMSVQDWEKAS